MAALDFEAARWQAGLVLTRIMDFLFGCFFRLFNFGLEKLNAGYVGTLHYVVRLAVLVLAVYAGLLYSDLPGFHDGSDWLYSGAGSGLSDCGAAVAGCVVD